MYKSEAHKKQLEAARAKAFQNPETREKRRKALALRWERDPELMLSGMRAMRSKEARTKAAMANRKPLHDKFWAKVSPEPNSGCWLWLGSCDHHGYGQMRVDGRGIMATHVSLQLAGVLKPFEGACARHKCDNPPCVNPDHLIWGTLKQNSHDALSRGRANLNGLKIGHEKMRRLAASRPVKPCENCGADCRPNNEQLKKNKNFFCTRGCSIAWQKANYTGRAISSWSGPSS